MECGVFWMEEVDVDTEARGRGMEKFALSVRGERFDLLQLEAM